MSSDLFSRKVNTKDFSLIYAGAQNIGPAGSTMIMVKRHLRKTGRKMLSMLVTILCCVCIKGESMYKHTSVFPVYVTMLTLRWLKQHGGISWIEKINQQKRDLLCGEIDRNSLFYGTTAKEDRSIMNVCFLMNKPEQEAEFDKFWKSCLLELTEFVDTEMLGGYRTSIYKCQLKAYKY